MTGFRLVKGKGNAFVVIFGTFEPLMAKGAAYAWIAPYNYLNHPNPSLP